MQAAMRAVGTMKDMEEGAGFFGKAAKGRAMSVLFAAHLLHATTTYCVHDCKDSKDGHVSNLIRHH